MTVAHILVPNLERLGTKGVSIGIGCLPDGVKNGEEATLVGALEHLFEFLINY